MKSRTIFLLLLAAGTVAACDYFNQPAGDGGGGPSPGDETYFENASSSNLPLSSLSGNTMDAQPSDVDGDGDPDLVLAIEFGPNIILLNDGSGRFAVAPSNRLPARDFDSEDVALADFDGDRDPDLFFANNDNLANEFYLNGGSGAFSDLTNRIPVAGRSNAALASDIDRDGDADLLIGNDGQNIILINTGNAIFTNQAADRLPQVNDITQDLEAVDIDGDGDPDLVVGNEDVNRILINLGSGFFADQTQFRLPLTGMIEETRDADLGDIDGDGDPDLYFANVALRQSGANPRDRLLINNGSGVFIDVTARQLPEITTNSMDADFVDLDGDGDPDLLIGDFGGGITVLINDGSGSFTDESADWIPENVLPRVMDFEAADYNGDGLTDVYVCAYDGPDMLLLQRPQ